MAFRGGCESGGGKQLGEKGSRVIQQCSRGIVAQLVLWCRVEERMNQLLKVAQDSKRIVIFTGSGLSATSGQGSRHAVGSCTGICKQAISDSATGRSMQGIRIINWISSTSKAYAAQLLYTPPGGTAGIGSVSGSLGSDMMAVACIARCFAQGIFRCPRSP
jgi:hypothetical protein